MDVADSLFTAVGFNHVIHNRCDPSGLIGHFTAEGGNNATDDTKGKNYPKVEKTIHVTLLYTITVM
jgi:hypothetical protein